MRDTHREAERHRKREKQAPCGELNGELDPRTPGSQPEPPGQRKAPDLKIPQVHVTSKVQDIDWILSCTASLLPTLPLRASLQACSSSPASLSLFSSFSLWLSWRAGLGLLLFLNVRIKVWLEKLVVVILTVFLHPTPQAPSPGPVCGGVPWHSQEPPPPAPPETRLPSAVSGGTSPPLPQAPSEALAGCRINVHSINPAPRSRWLPRPVLDAWCLVLLWD